MKLTDWILLTIFLAVFFGGTIFLPIYYTHYVIAQNGFFALSSVAMIIFSAITSYLSLDFIVGKWKDKAWQAYLSKV